MYREDGVYKVTIVVDTDLDRLHDVVLDITDVSKTEDELLDIFNSLSENTKYIAYRWSAGDTEFGDAAYKELTERLEDGKAI